MSGKKLLPDLIGHRQHTNQQCYLQAQKKAVGCAEQVALRRHEVYGHGKAGCDNGADADSRE